MNYEFKINKKRCLEVIRLAAFSALCTGFLSIHYVTSNKDIISAVLFTTIFLSTLYLCIKMFQLGNRKEPLLIATPQGIIEKFFGYGFISYSEIKNIELINDKKHTKIEIKITNANNILQRLNKKQQIKAKKALNKNYIQIPALFFEDDPKEIANILRNALNTYQHQTIMANNN